MPPRRHFLNPPPLNYEDRMLPVGMLNLTFANEHGPQRNRPADSARYRSTLRTRSRAYGAFNPVLLRPRVVSYREDTRQYYTLDGNSSNHWLEEMFGPSYLVPCRVVSGLTLAEENRIFQDLQKLKKVTLTEKHRSDVEFDDTSQAYLLSKIFAEEGFQLGQRTNSPVIIGVSAGAYILNIGGEARLRDTLRIIRECFPDDDEKRTNNSLVKAISLVLGNEEYERERLVRAMKKAGSWALFEGAQGRLAETHVVPRIREFYEATE